MVAQGALGSPPSLPPGEGTGPAVMLFVLAPGLGAAVLSEECGSIERTQRREAELSGHRLELRWVLSFSPQPPCALCPWPLEPFPLFSPLRSVWTYVYTRSTHTHTGGAGGRGCGRLAPEPGSGSCLPSGPKAGSSSVPTPGATSGPTWQIPDGREGGCG